MIGGRAKARPYTHSLMMSIRFRRDVFHLFAFDYVSDWAGC